MTTVITTSPGFGKHGRVPNIIAERGWTFIRCADNDALIQHIENADILVVGLPPVDEHILAKGKTLKAVLKHGVGVDNIDIPACSARKLPVCNTPAANADAVAELAVGFLFALARHIPQGHASVTSGGWNRYVGRQLGGKTLGIVGLGNIGKRLAKLAHGLGMHVMAHDAYPDQTFAAQHNIQLCDLPTLLGEADYVSLHIFGGKENTALINADTLALMKPSACLINLARGEVVDLDAVAQALAQGRLAGVAIDAYIQEPPDTKHPIFQEKNAIFTPHSGADTLEALENVGLMVIESIDAVLRGEVPPYCLNRDAL